LRRHRALRDYRAIVREIEADAFATCSSGSLDAKIHREYERRLVAAAAMGVPFGSLQPYPAFYQLTTAFR
jgi:hypothetical protein